MGLKYKIVASASPEGLEHRVTLYCNQGWSPLGPPFVVPRYSVEVQKLAQAMVKEDASCAD